MSAIRKILITGATGKQGGAVLRALLRSGEPISIHALTRNVSSPSALALSEKGVHLVKGSFTDPSSLVQAFQGIDAAFLFTNNTGDKEAEEGIALVDAAKEAGVKFVVFTSVDGAERKSGVPHFDTKFEVEEHIRKVGLAHTILRPVAFMDSESPFGTPRDSKSLTVYLLPVDFPKKSGMGASMVFGIFDAALRSSGASQKPVQLIAVRDIGALLSGHHSTSCSLADALCSSPSQDGLALKLCFIPKSTAVEPSLSPVTSSTQFKSLKYMARLRTRAFGRLGCPSSSFVSSLPMRSSCSGLVRACLSS